VSHRITAALASTLALASGPGFAQTAPAGAAAEPETVVVTGSMIRRSDVETPSPVTIITAADIQNSGLTTISDVIRAISADNSGTIPTAFGIGFAAGSSGVALRGLTVNSTLVLIDGRRATAYPLADDGQRSFVDLNTIPLDAVESVEVLKDGASALYGADAIAGVVNIKLKQHFQGFSGSVELGNSAHGGGFEKRATATFGAGDLKSDRFNAFLNLEYEKDNRIATGQRGFPFNTADLSSIGGINLQGGQPSQNSGSTFGSVTPGTLNTPGNLLSGVPNAGAVAQPLRPCGAGTTQVTDAQGTYCSQNRTLFGVDAGAQERAAVYSRITVQLSDHAQAYLSAGYFQNAVEVPSPPNNIQTSTPINTNNIALPPTLPTGALNPNDPFANAACAATSSCPYALINYAFGDEPVLAKYKNHVARLIGGVTGTVAGWDYDTAAVINHAWLDVSQSGFVSFRQLMSDVVNVTYSFVNPAQNSPATLAALSPTTNKTSTTDMDSIDLKVSRSLMTLSGGSLGLALGAEMRYEAQNDPALNPNADLEGLGLARTVGNRSVYASYVELDAPVLSSLEIDLAGRYDHYSDFGGKAVPKIGLRWRPLQQVMLRGTFSKGFRAPAFAENGSSEAEGFITAAPPASFATLHGNDGYVQPYTYGLLTTANPQIKPETSTNYTYGLVLDPTTYFNVSVDYYHIKKDGVIAQANANTALNAYYAGQPIPAGYVVTPDLPDPAFPNALPRVAVVASPYVNANSLTTDGVDVDLRMKFNLGAAGSLTSELDMTRILKFIYSPLGQPDQSYVGTQGPFILSSGAGTPRDRASWTNTWNMGPATLTGIVRYVSGFAETADDIQPGLCLYNLAYCHVASFTVVDLTGGFKVSDHLQVSAAVENVLDRKAPIDPADYAGINYNPTYHQEGIIGRFFRVGVRFTF
jgi:iron complex outermembrane receptor protein